MLFFKALTLSALVASAASYKILTPTLNSTITKGTDVDITYSYVDTDADTFSVYLVNFVDFPPLVLSLAQNVPRDAGSVSVRIPCDVDSDYGWQLNFINGTNTYVIYAQSAKFSLTGTCVDPTTSSSVAVSTTTAYKNSTVTATTTTTATVEYAVQTVIYESPCVWFVQPSALAEAAAVCPASAAQQTVTVYAAGAAPSTVTVYASGEAPATVTKAVTVTVAVASTVSETVTVCPGSAAAAGATTTSAVAVVPYSNYTAASASGVPSATTTGLATFTGAATLNKVGGAIAAVVGGALVFML